MSQESSAKSVTQILQSLGSRPELQAELERFRRNITVLFTDIKGSTAYFDKYGDAAGLAMVHACTEAQTQRVLEYGGKVVKTTGDGVMATFESATEGLRAAVAMQNDMRRLNVDRPDESRVYLRTGLHYGPGIVKSNDVFGDVVNVASRIQSAAQPEQILVSDKLVIELETSLFAIRSLGRFAFKGKDGEQDIFEVVWNDDTVTTRVPGHTLVVSSPATRPSSYYVQHVRPDGALGTRTRVPPDGLTIGRNDGDLTFPDDEHVAPVHARLLCQGEQLVVTDLSDGHNLMVKVLEPYLLQDGDVIKIGRQVLRFSAAAEAVAAAANTGTPIGQLNAMISAPVAQIKRLNPPKPDDPVLFPINADLVTLGRERGTYTFPDDGFMSRTHVKVYQRGEDFFLEDLGSRNGTFIKVRGRAPVPSGSAILIGRQMFQISSH